MTEVKYHERVRFADFEFDGLSGDLRRDGISLKLQPQPAKVLAVLIRRSGQVVSRQELAEEVWGSGTFVDFDQGLNYAIRHIRTVLGDDAEQPRFLETLPKRGYRFIAPLEDLVAPKEDVDAAPRLAAPATTNQKRGLRFLLGFAGIAWIVTVLIVTYWGPFRARSVSPNRNRIESLAVLPLHNLSRDPEQEYFSDGMTDDTTVRLNVEENQLVNVFSEFGVCVGSLKSAQNGRFLKKCDAQNL